jgi:hypothetical protein
VYGEPPGWKGIWKRGDIGLISKWTTGKSGRERDFVRARHRRGNFRSIAVITVCVSVLATISGGAMQLEAVANLPPSLIETQLDGGLNPRDRAVADQLASRFAEQVSNVEWLAPLAPIALSPFFGLTLLSGLACYGPDWLPDNPLLSERSPFSDPRFFWIFLVLTVVTSLPRFSKVSKPIAQFADFLETWSAIIILVALRLFTLTAENQEPDVAVQAGILSMSWQGLLIVAMVINLIVINSVKFFFEFLGLDHTDSIAGCLFRNRQQGILCRVDGRLCLQSADRTIVESGAVSGLSDCFFMDPAARVLLSQHAD